MDIIQAHKMWRDNLVFILTNATSNFYEKFNIELTYKMVELLLYDNEKYTENNFRNYLMQKNLKPIGQIDFKFLEENYFDKYAKITISENFDRINKIY
jgi:hypothetical protein